MRLTEYGFSLIEVLISVFVLVVGVIGALGMHMHALRTAQQSSYQTRALHLAADMADAMRANVEQMRLDDHLNPYLQVDYQSSTSSRSVNTFACYGASGRCDSQELAKFEIAQLQQHIDADFPSGRVRICRDASPWNEVIQRYEWDCASASNASMLAPLVIKIGWHEKIFNHKTAQDDVAVAPMLLLAVATYSK